MRSLLRTVLSFALVALSLAPVAALAQTTDAGTVVVAWENALNAGDANTALALWTDDSVLKEIPPPAGTTGVFSGKDQLRAVFQGADNGGSHGEDGAAAPPGAVDSGCNFYWNVVTLAVHPMKVNLLGVDRLEGPQPHLQRDGGDFDTAAAKLLKGGGGKM